MERGMWMIGSPNAVRSASFAGVHNLGQYCTTMHKAISTDLVSRDLYTIPINHDNDALMFFV